MILLFLLFFIFIILLFTHKKYNKLLQKLKYDMIQILYHTFPNFDYNSVNLKVGSKTKITSKKIISINIYNTNKRIEQYDKLLLKCIHEYSHAIQSYINNIHDHQFQYIYYKLKNKAIELGFI